MEKLKIQGALGIKVLIHHRLGDGQRFCDVVHGGVMVTRS
jgi:hypothetical protein